MKTLQLSKLDPSFAQTTHATPKAAATPSAPPSRPQARSRFTAGLALAACVQMAAGCGGAEALTPKVVLVDHTVAKLSLGALNALNGTYGQDCIGRSGSSWSSPIGGFSGALDHDPLSVVKGNGDCVLTLTSVLIGSIRYLPASTVDLTDSYSNSAVAYSAEGDTAIAFYGNLKLSDATYTSSFSISLLYSDDSGAASAGQTQSSYKYNTISSTQGTVVPPDYTVDGSSVAVQTDANKVISDVAGFIDLTDGMLTGQEYVISSVDLGASPSFDEIDAAFRAGTPVTISAANPSIAAGDLGLVGTSLAASSAIREVIVAHIVNNIRAYQVITLTVLAP